MFTCKQVIFAMKETSAMVKKKITVRGEILVRMVREGLFGKAESKYRGNADAFLWSRVGDSP